MDLDPGPPTGYTSLSIGSKGAYLTWITKICITIKSRNARDILLSKRGASCGLPQTPITSSFRCDHSLTRVLCLCPLAYRRILLRETISQGLPKASKMAGRVVQIIVVDSSYYHILQVEPPNEQANRRCSTSHSTSKTHPSPLLSLFRSSPPNNTALVLPPLSSST